MLPETSGMDPNELSGTIYQGYTHRRQAGWRTRWAQVMHLLMRPVSLRLSAYFVRRYNEHLYVESRDLDEALARIEDGDRVLWINPSLAVRGWIESLLRRQVTVYLHFVDPVHRLGLSHRLVQMWAKICRVTTYSMEEAVQLGLGFLAPFAPVCAPPRSDREFDVVYVGSPSPKRLLWLIALRFHLWWRQGRGHLRLASRNQSLARWFPQIFSPRLDFKDYAALCARSRGVLELHERDAAGVTFRVTLCQALGVTHLCNLPITSETITVSLLGWGPMDEFLLHGRNNSRTSAPALGALSLDVWLESNFS